jgi:hypothetical protein
MTALWWDAPADALADLLSELRPTWNRGPRTILSPAARQRAARVLRALRGHDRDIALMVWALEKADAGTVETIRGCARIHRLLRLHARELCGRLRRRDVPGARAAARQMLGLHLSHAAGERVLISGAVQALTPSATACFAGRLWSGRKRGRGTPPGFVSEIYSIAIRLMSQAGHRARDPYASEVLDEHPNRR